MGFIGLTFKRLFPYRWTTGFSLVVCVRLRLGFLATVGTGGMIVTITTGDEDVKGMRGVGPVLFAG